MNNRIKTIIFTDLDGTLLDYSTYSFEAAMPALKRLQECGIPLVIVSSKTRAEIEPLLAELPPLSKLFITENGSAVYLDRQSPVPPGIQAELRAGYRAIILGCRYDEVLSALREELAFYGNSPEQIDQQIETDVRAIVQQAYTQGKNPGELFYGYAKMRGYSPAQAVRDPVPAQVAAQVNALAEAQR